ncbi:hypothetical protein O6H91_06G049900 [Diphasiastrum complanatum]|uniref:Uncharacterized protein n=1 Tax=Diphasiastrum complanatum TaxID=34168 RepID=A0ACC2DDF2_DIPCM|nr:hypothetical protein O6H91_06G049900 [Diphasiastrum complanatum]
MSGKKKGKEEEGKGGMAEALERDALLAIFELLPARALASAACVCRSWYYGVQTICSRPCIVSALSLQPNLKFAMEEVLEKVLAQPFRPQFAILFAGQKFNLSKISYMLKSNLPGGIVVIGCHAAGLIGLDVATNKQKEVVFRHSETRSTTHQKSAGLVLTLGCFPGVHVETISLKNFYSENDVKNFVDQAGAGAFHGSGCEAPLSIVLLAKPRSDIKSLLERLDGAFMGKTIVTGGLCVDNLDNCLLSQCFTNDEPLVDDHEKLGQLATTSRGLEFEMKSRDQGTSKFLGSRSTTRVCKKQTCGQSSSNVTYKDVVGLVFKQVDSHRNEGDKFLHCHVVASGGLVPVGPVYVVVSVRETKDPVLQEATTWLTCMRENDDKELDGLSLFEDLDAQVGGDNSYLCIGVVRHRRRSNRIGQQEVFHLYEVQGADEEHLYVDGKGIKTGDKLRFYCTDAKAARLENIQKLNELEENVKSEAHASVTGPSKARKPSQVGALMFSCIGRGEEYFGEANVDSGDLLERFPDIPLSGMFCLGEIGPPSILPWETMNFSKPQQRQTVMNMYSTVCTLYSQDV